MKPEVALTGLWPSADTKLPKEVRQYQLLCLLGLAVVFLTDLQQGALLLSLLVLLVGLLGMLSRMRLGPIVFLLVLAGAQLARQLAPRRFGAIWVAPGPGIRLADLVLAMGSLGYVLAHYRMQGLMLSILPRDPRRRDSARLGLFGRPRILAQPRSVSLVSPQEVGWFLLGLPIWAFLAQGLWTILAPSRQVVGLPDWLVRLMIFAWALGVGMWLTTAWLNYWRRQGEPQAAALFLQDVLWRETRGEQRRLNRWLAWFRLRKKRPD